MTSARIASGSAPVARPMVAATPSSPSQRSVATGPGEEVATLVVLLASPRTTNVVGSDYVIDGGLVKTM